PPVNSRFNRQHHSLSDRACSSLMCKRRLVRASTHAMADGVRWLSGISTFCNPRAHQAIQLREACSMPCVIYCFIENTQQKVEQFLIRSGQSPRTRIFGEVSPVAIHAYPDFEKRRFVLLDGAIASCGEGRDSLSRPDQSECAGHLDFALVANSET